MANKGRQIMQNNCYEYFNAYIRLGEPEKEEKILARQTAELINRKPVENVIQGTDIVSERITELLLEQAFHMSLVTLMHIHKKLFTDILPDAGKLRSEAAQELEKSLRACFEAERASSYRGLTMCEVKERLDAFAKELLELVPFAEGNKYAVLVFMEKYKQFKGIRYQP